MRRNRRQTEPQPSPLSAETLLEAILDHSAEGFVFVDRRGVIQACSAEVERLYGQAAGELCGLDEGVLRLEVPRAQDGERAVQADEQFSIPLGGAGDQLSPVRIRSVPVHDDQGHDLGVLKIVRDITDDLRAEAELKDRERSLSDALRALRTSHQQLKSTQLQLIQAAKLESMGRIAAGVAHEVKNPLAIILTGTQMLRVRLPLGDRVVDETLEDLEHAVRRANGIIGGLLDFAASTALKPEVVALEEVIAASVQLVRHEFSAGRVRIVRREESALPKLNLDRAKIEQVLVNLMVNAVHAMPDGGTLTLTTSLRQLTAPGHGVGFRQSDVLRVGQTVAVVEIDDTGGGIPDGILARIFDPFFTTKGPGKGAGLGLAVSRTIVSLHGGSIWLENRPDGGARATLVLPAGENRRGDPHEEA